MQPRGLFGLIVLVADVWAIVNILQSSADTGKKVLWTVLVDTPARARIHTLVFPGSENRQDEGA